MKHILLLTLAVATVALLGGCASDDYGPGNQDKPQSNHYEQQQPSMGGGGY